MHPYNTRNKFRTEPHQLKKKPIYIGHNLMNYKPDEILNTEPFSNLLAKPVYVLNRRVEVVVCSNQCLGQLYCIA